MFGRLPIRKLNFAVPTNPRNNLVEQDMSSNREFPCNLPKSVDRLKLLVDNKYLADVVFKVGTPRQLIYAHKNIISIGSEVFFTMFYRDARINYNENPIVIEDIEPTAFLLMLKFIYCDEIELSADNVVDVLYAAQKYRLHELIDRCRKFVQTINDEITALTILDNNHHRKIQAVDVKCLAIIRDNPLKVFDLNLFGKLNQRTVVLIAGSRTMNCYMEHLQEAIEQWKKAFPITARKNEIVPRLEALQCCKLTSFSEFQFLYSIDTKLVLTVQKPLHLYGLGIFIGEKELATTAGGLLDLNLDIKGANTVSVSKKVALKDNLYTCEIFFEKVTITDTGYVNVTVSNRTKQARELFCLKEFVPVKLLGDVKLAVETKSFTHCKVHDKFEFKNLTPNPVCCPPKCCIAYFLYNVE